VRGRTPSNTTSPWALSQLLAITGQPSTPPAPVGVTAVGGTRQITLSWEPVDIPNPLYYSIQRAPGNSSGPTGSYTPLTTVFATSYTDTESTVLLPLTWWWYIVSVTTTNNIMSPWSSQAGAETTALLVDDLPLAIQQTAAWAQTMLSGAPTVVTSLPGAPAGGVGFVLLETPTAEQPWLGQLYQWVAAESMWVSCPLQMDIENGIIVAAEILAGAVAADQIAANSIHANMLASDFALFNYEQVGLLTVNNLNVVGGSISNFFSAHGSNTGAGTVVLNLSINANADGSVAEQVGICIASFTAGAGDVDLTVEYGVSCNIGSVGALPSGAVYTGTAGPTGAFNMPGIGSVTLYSGNSYVFTLAISAGFSYGQFCILTRGV